MHIVWSDQTKSNVREIYNYYKEAASLKIARSIKSAIIRKPLLLLKYPEIVRQKKIRKSLTGDLDILLKGIIK